MRRHSSTCSSGHILSLCCAVLLHMQATLQCLVFVTFAGVLRYGNYALGIALFQKGITYTYLHCTRTNKKGRT